MAAERWTLYDGAYLATVVAPNLGVEEDASYPESRAWILGLGYSCLRIKIKIPCRVEAVGISSQASFYVLELGGPHNP